MYDYHLLDRIAGLMSYLQLLTCQITIYDFCYTDQRTCDFPHAHPFHEFYFLLRGSACIWTKEREFHLKEGDLLYVAPKTQHCFVAERSPDCGYVNVAFDFLTSAVPSTTPYKTLLRCEEIEYDEQFLIRNLTAGGTRCVKDHNGCRQEVDSIVTCLGNTFFGDTIRLFAYETCFFLSALQNFSQVLTREDFPLIDQFIRNRTCVKAVMIAQYVWEHCDEDISIDTLADTLHYSKRSIQRMLDDYYSIGFSKLLNHYRVAKLKSALRNGTDTLESFAERCGYSNTRSLSRHFQEITGMTVAQYKQDLKRSRDT